jgi:hypothetical protein
MPTEKVAIFYLVWPGAKFSGLLILSRSRKSGLSCRTRRPAQDMRHTTTGPCALDGAIANCTYLVSRVPNTMHASRAPRRSHLLLLTFSVSPRRIALAFLVNTDHSIIYRAFCNRWQMVADEYPAKCLLSAAMNLKCLAKGSPFVFWSANFDSRDQIDLSDRPWL